MFPHVQVSELFFNVTEKGKAHFTFKLRKHKDGITFPHTPSEEVRLGLRPVGPEALLR